MGTDSHEEREVRAARNQALFRSVNEKMRQLNEDVASVTGSFTIACECADTGCLEMIEIAPAEYLAVRGQPRRFVVLEDHVYADVETIVGESDGYVVVEKTETAGEVAEQLTPEDVPSGR
jgi:hypothetical protein